MPYIPSRRGYRQEIEAFHFERSPDEMPDFMDLLLYYMGATDPEEPQWLHYSISSPYSTLSAEFVRYSVCGALEGYFTSLINHRHMEAVGMEYRDMVIANYRKAGGDLRHLTTIGMADIKEDDVKTSIVRAFVAKGKSIYEKRLNEVTMDRTGWNELKEGNYLLEDQIEMCRDYAHVLRHPHVKKVTLISYFPTRDYLLPVLFMFTTLTRE
ncbi:hypothetical protein F5B20DRAFT_580344 [Whalleya microplaca]|nr:hypothetical protein F5B20DRAFT_580344 [Whalleya microplaca]